MRSLLRSVHQIAPTGFRFYFAVVVSSCLLTGCDIPSRKNPAVLTDAPLSTSQAELLQVAFDAASAMPLKPHIKDRARAQEKVVDACFELEQPQTALQYIKQIPNWRRGLGYANYSFYSVQHGVTNQVDVLLQEAESIAKVATQEWRTDAVLKRIKQVRSLLSNPESSKSAEAGDPSSLPFEKKLAEVDQEISSGELTSLQAGMNTCCSLYKEFYNQNELRARVEQKMDVIRRKLPVFIRLQYMKKMVRVALGNDDMQTAHRLIDEMEQFISDNTWPVEYEVRVTADLASLQAECGDLDSAAVTLDKAQELYEKNQAKIVDIERADALVPVAESALAAGQQDRAMAIYQMAMKASLENPNSRPRANDLCLICISMALNAVEPSEECWSALKSIKAGLGNPW